MTGEFCGASLFRGFPAFQRPTEAREKERHLRNIEIPGYRRGHNIPEANLEPPYFEFEVGGNGLAIAVFPCLTTHLCTSVRHAAMLIWASAA